MSDTQAQWITVTEAAQKTGVSERTIWRWVRSGYVESMAVRRGGHQSRRVRSDTLPMARAADPGLPIVSSADTAADRAARLTRAQWTELARQTRLARQIVERARQAKASLTIAELVVLLHAQEQLAQSMADA